MANIRGHTFSCPLDDWFSAFLDDKDNDAWSAAMASDARKQLDKKEVLHRDGWVALAANFAKKPALKEDDVHSTLNSIYKAIIETAKELHDNELVATTLSRTTPSGVPELDVPGTNTRPNGQSTLVVPPVDDTSVGIEDHLPMSEPEEKCRASKQASLCAGIYEFKRSEADRLKVFYIPPFEMTGTDIVDTELRANGPWGVPAVLQQSTSTLHLRHDDRKDFDEALVFQPQLHMTTHEFDCNESWSMNSRAVRVWTVRSVDEDGKFLEDDEEEHVLKDVWLYDDIIGEKDNQDIIMQAAKDLDTEIPVTDERSSRVSTLRDLFLTILHDWRVQAEKDGKMVEDSASQRPGNAQLSSLTALVLLAATKSSAKTRHSEQQTPHSETASDPHSDKLELKHHHRIYRRIVFKEKCMPFSQIDTLGLVTWSLAMTQRFLRNWVLAQRYQHWKLSRLHGRNPTDTDLEYCKLYKDISKHPTTGTLEFMGTEVRHKELLFQTAKAIASEVETKLLPQKVAETEEVQPVFHVHYYHDLEGIIRLFLWFLLSHVPQSFNGTATTEQIFRWRCRFDDLFKGDTTFRRRSLFFGVQKLKHDIRKWGWHKGLYPLLEVLECLPVLGGVYQRLENEFKDDIYIHLSNSLFDAYELIEGIDSKLDLANERHNASFPGRKRAAHGDDHEDEEEITAARPAKRANTGKGKTVRR
ncbi:hypothetical protein FA15DRAFT_700568 [Coprinopsis marcescibilis]|uniref:Fungal-type protein kinase domain-containing protein n=1 Tax=Coprinopsis marcescibilis TaxID=230819 RepID=A0A5C3LK38_COPMA|nr:hypothetical protein FA15DRAFT_700568 [Coprinopsis marcescibilis]